MEKETDIVETFRFDFTYKERDAERLNSIFEKNGYPNLRVSLTDSYDGYWSVEDVQNNERIWTEYHSGFVTFFTEDKNLKIAFNHRINDNNRSFDTGTKIYFKEGIKALKNEETIEQLKRKIKFLEKENSELKKKLKGI